MDPRALVLSCVGLLACSGEAPAPPIVEEPAAPTAPPEVPAPEAPALAPPAETLPPIVDVEVEAFTPAAGWEGREVSELAEGEPLTLSDEDLYEVFELPTFDVPQREALVQALTARVERVATAARDPGVEGRCRATLATSALVSLQCVLEGNAGRTEYDRGLFAWTYRLDGEGAHEAPVETSVLPGTDLSAIAHVACERERTARVEEGEEGLEGVCEWGATLSFGARGFVAVFSNEERHDLEVVVPYDAPELHGRLRVEGPLAGLVPIGERTRATIAGSDGLAASLAIDPSVAWAFGAEAPLEAMLLAIDRSASPSNAVFVGAGGARLAFRAEASTPDELTRRETEARLAASNAAALGGAFGGAMDTTLYRVPSVTVVDVARLVVTTPVNVREAPGTDGALRGTLSIGTRVVGVHGRVDGHSSERGGRGSWVWVMAAEGLSGWVSGRYLDAATLVPRPTLEAHGEVPDDAFAQLGRHALLGSVGSAHFAVLASRPRSWILVSSSSAFADVVRTIAIEGHVDEVRWSSSRDGVDVAIIGASSVAPGEPGFDGTMHWHLVAPGATTPGWSIDARTHPALPESERDAVAFEARAAGATFPLTVTPRGGRARRARWDGTSFVER